MSDPLQAREPGPPFSLRVGDRTLTVDATPLAPGRRLLTIDWVFADSSPEKLALRSSLKSHLVLILFGVVAGGLSLLLSLPGFYLGACLVEGSIPTEDRSWWVSGVKAWLLLWVVPAVLGLVITSTQAIYFRFRPQTAPEWYRKDVLKMFGPCFVSCVIALPALAYLEGHPFDSLSTWLRVFFGCLSWGVAGIFALLGVMLLVGFLPPVRVTLDHLKARVWWRECCFGFRCLPFNRIVAVQVVPVPRPAGVARDGPVRFEINFVVDDPSKPRKQLVDYRDLAQARQVAQSISAFLGVPLIDHAPRTGLEPNTATW